MSKLHTFLQKPFEPARFNLMLPNLVWWIYMMQLEWGFYEILIFLFLVPYRLIVLPINKYCVSIVPHILHFNKKKSCFVFLSSFFMSLFRWFSIPCVSFHVCCNIMLCLCLSLDQVVTFFVSIWTLFSFIMETEIQYLYKFDWLFKFILRPKVVKEILKSKVFFFFFKDWSSFILINYFVIE